MELEESKQLREEKKSLNYTIEIIINPGEIIVEVTNNFGAVK